MSNDNNQDDDSTLFREAMKSVTPLKTRNRTQLQPPRKPVATRRSAPEDMSAQIFSTEPVADCPSQLSFARSGVQHSVLKKLRQGKIDVEHRLDLHGMIVEQARTELITFLDECASSGVRCALIVHGKGYRSPGNKPVIKPLVNRWLRESPQVLAFVSALPKDGGSGAVYVLFKRSA